MKHGLAPIFNQETELLILGSGPSDISIAKQEYYANKGNQFWKVIFASLLLDDPLIYDKRVALLMQNKIGLWDVYHSFDRKGSLDSNFKETKLNDFSTILVNSSIKYILANGNESFRTIQQNHLFTNLSVMKCSSTSGANNGRHEQRKKEWYEALTVLQRQ